MGIFPVTRNENATEDSKEKKSSAGLFNFDFTMREALDSVERDFNLSNQRDWSLYNFEVKSEKSVSSGSEGVIDPHLSSINLAKITKGGKQYSIEDSFNANTGTIQYYGYGLLIGTTFCLFPAMWLIRHRVPRNLLAFCTPVLLCSFVPLYRDMQLVGRELAHVEKIKAMRAQQEKTKETVSSQMKLDLARSDNVNHVPTEA